MFFDKWPRVNKARFTKALLLAKISRERQRRRQLRRRILTLVMIRKRLLVRVCYCCVCCCSHFAVIVAADGAKFGFNRFHSFLYIVVIVISILLKTAF